MFTVLFRAHSSKRCQNNIWQGNEDTHTHKQNKQQIDVRIRQHKREHEWCWRSWKKETETIIRKKTKKQLLTCKVSCLELFGGWRRQTGQSCFQATPGYWGCLKTEIKTSARRQTPRHNIWKTKKQIYWQLKKKKEQFMHMYAPVISRTVLKIFSFPGSRAGMPLYSSLWAKRNK